MIAATSLDELWQEVYRLNKEHFPRNELFPIVGNGCTHKPEVMFVFINPTHKNMSSEKHWRGPRYPFIGTKQVWRILARAGLFDERLLHEINRTNAWTMDLAERVLSYLRDRGFYITNIVKWTGSDSKLPDRKKISIFLPILEKEIEIVQPKYIVAFGLIPFEQLTKQKIKLAEYYAAAMKTKQPKQFPITIGGVQTKVILCYFPVGRGDPKRAVELLKLLPS